MVGLCKPRKTRTSGGGEQWEGEMKVGGLGLEGNGMGFGGKGAVNQANQTTQICTYEIAPAPGVPQPVLGGMQVNRLPVSV